MANCATQPERFGVVSLIRNLAYLHGYKSAVFDSHFRFTRPNDPEAVSWKYEERVLNEIATILWSVLESEPTPLKSTESHQAKEKESDMTVSADQVRKALGDYLADISAHNSEESTYFECASQTVERLLAAPKSEVQRRDPKAEEPGLQHGSTTQNLIDQSSSKLPQESEKLLMGEKSQKLAA